MLSGHESVLNSARLLAAAFNSREFRFQIQVSSVGPDLGKSRRSHPFNEVIEGRTLATSRPN